MTRYRKKSATPERSNGRRTWKNSIAGLPFGGAKSGIVADDKKLTQELKRYEELVFSFLSMIRKHKEVKEYVYIMKSDKETLDIERDWYRYCVAYLQLIDSKIEIVRTARDYPFAIKEVEEKFSGILLKRELKMIM